MSQLVATAADVGTVFLKCVVLDDSFHAADANRGAALDEFLSDDFGGCLGVEETVPNNLSDDFVGTTIVMFGSAFLRG